MKNNNCRSERRTLSLGQRALLLLIAVFTAIAVAVACIVFMDTAPNVSVDEVTPGDVSQSASYTDRTGNLTSAGAIAKGDILNYTYKGTVVSVTLPTGTYTLEVWGAQGGTCSHGTSTNNSGGYAKVTFNVKAASTTIYLCVGGQGGKGTSNSCAGGYNGGGKGGPTRVADMSGGGGATHIALRTGELRSLSSYQSHVLLVAGGGGGNGCSRVGGKGGGASGTNGSSSNYGYGASATAAGRAGTNTTIGGFGYGGYTTATNSNYGSGGGGGGWYGGGAGRCYSGGGGAGGGGSGHIGNATLPNGDTLSGGSMTVGGNTGNGRAKITVQQVNIAPTSRSANISNTGANYYRGTSRNIAIAASTLARDPDYSNCSSPNENVVYFTNGNSANYDSIPAGNNGLYLDQGCTKPATNYFSWSWTNSTLTISEIKRYPRSGVDGSTADGRITLYTKVRDNYGTTTTRGVTVVSFTFNVNNNQIDLAPARTIDSNVPNVKYRYGTPTITGDENKGHNFLADDSIYNPISGSTARTLFIPKPISPTDTAGYTINASDLYTDGDGTYDVVAFKTVASTAQSAYYNISYGGTIGGLSTSLTIRPTGVRPTEATFVCAQITAQTRESATNAAIGKEFKDVYLVFRIANTRPYFASSSAVNTGIASEPYIELAQGASVDFNIESLVYDTDDATLTSRFAGELIVPTNEYVQVDLTNTSVPLATTCRDGKPSNYAAFNDDIADNTYLTGMGNTSTGFAGKSDVIALAGTSAVATANVTYSFGSDGKTITFTGRSATQYMYTDKDTDRARRGDFYVLVRLIDPSDASDGGLWYPIAIKVTSSAPVNTTPVGSAELVFDPYNVEDTSKEDITASDVLPEAVFTPISYVDENGVVRGIGVANRADAASPLATQATPFAVDPDTFVYAGTGGALNTMVLNDFALLNGTEVTGSGSGKYICNLYDTETFFTVETANLWAPRSVFTRLGMSSADLTAAGVVVEADNICRFQGLRVKAIRSTNDNYFMFDVNVKDTLGTESTVGIAIKISNREVAPRRSDYENNQNEFVPTSYPINTTKYGKYAYNNNVGAAVVTYTINKNDSFYITPYDFAYDLDIDGERKINPTTGFNSNPDDEGFADIASYITHEYDIPHMTTLTAEPSTDAVKAQQLDFANTANIIANAEQYSNYIGLTVEKVSGIPTLKIVGLSRTTSTVVQLRFTVTDGYTSVQVTVTVVVRNSAPELNVSALKAPYILSAASGVGHTHTEYLTASTIATDRDDGDTPTFVSGGVSIVAYDKEQDDYFTMLTADFKGTDDVSNAKYILSDYVYTTITKNGNGEDVAQITGLSSTQLFPCPIYLQANIQDGFRAQPESALLYVLLEVENTAPTFEQDNLTDVNGSKVWLINNDNDAEKSVSRYIFNSRELSESGVISAATANKIWLFDDLDGEQEVMLNPKEWSDSLNDATGLVARIDENSSAFKSEEEINRIFDNTPRAAILYGKTYSGNSTTESQYLTIEVMFFKKAADGSFVRSESNDRLSELKYWAIRISDRVTAGKEERTHIVFRVRDDHNGAEILTPDKSAAAEKLNTSLTVYNMFYEYRSPKVIAMHEYYRTDGNSESQIFVEGTELYKDGYYMVDVDSLYTSYQYTAVQTYQVTFDYNYAGAPAPYYALAATGRTVTPPSSPSRDGFTFNGWFTAASGGSAYVFTTPVTGDLTLYAQWTETAVTPTTYPVTFNLNYTDAPAAQEDNVEDGQTATRPADPTRENHTFGGWFENAECSGNAFDFTTPITAAKTLYAKWTYAPPAPTQYTVTFDYNDGGVTAETSESVNANAQVSEPAAPTRTGYDFKGWTTRKDDSTAKFDFTSAITEDLRLFALWEAVVAPPVTQYNVTFNYNDDGTTADNVVTVNDGDKVTRPATDPKREGYDFAGWFDAQTGGNAFDFDTAITANTTVYAQWTPQTSGTAMFAMNRAARADDNRQAALAYAVFNENFRYQYFVKTITEDAGASVSIPTSKKYPQSSRNAFYYKPVEVLANGDAVSVPMSYLAMPGVGATDTENGTHVTLANVSTTGEPGKLNDSQYLHWGDGDMFNLVAENLTLTDSFGAQWSGSTLKDNPYLEIGYTADANYINSGYLNTHRGVVTRTQDGTVTFGTEDGLWLDGNVSKFREDKYGFTFKKRTEKARRATGPLTFTVAVKTSGAESEVQNVSVQITVGNAKPNSLTFAEDKKDSAFVDLAVDGTPELSEISEVAVRMTTSYTAGKTVMLNRGTSGGAGDVNIYYQDTDSTDTMKFLISSATGKDDGKGNIIGGMTAAEIAYISGSTNVNNRNTAVASYYAVDDHNKATAEYRRSYVPNPGYERFFSISPATGAASTLQIIPKAKTQLNIPTEIKNDPEKYNALLAQYHLKADNRGDIYYPFRILFYDDCNNSAFTAGSWMNLTLKVYIYNNELRVNENIVTEKYTEQPNSPYLNTPVYSFSVSKGTNASFYLDMTPLFVDNDIALTSSSTFEVDDTNTEKWTDEFKLFNDYFVAPASSAATIINASQYPSFAGLPITIEKMGAATSMPETTYKITAKSAFNNDIYLLYSFSDNAERDKTVSVIFKISYNNEAPTAESSTFGGSNVRNVTLKTGESFTLYASDRTLFGGDVNGGFYKPTDADLAGYPDTTASLLASSFGIVDANGKLGSLVIGADDAPSTLRIRNNGNSFFDPITGNSDPNAGNYINLAYGNITQVANGTGTAPMSLTVTARGVTNTVLAVELFDAKGVSTTVRFNITVTTTPPQLNKTELPNTLKLVETEDGNTLATTIKCGADNKLNLTFKRFMTDIDRFDDNGFDVYTNVDGSTFTVLNPNGSSAVSVEKFRSGNSDTEKGLSITANDIIPNGSEYATVSFRVTDSHGGVSPVITIRVYVEAEDLSSVTTLGTPYVYTVKSYADYATDGAASSVDIVTADRNTATVFTDPDAGAASANYNVSIYAMLQKDSAGGFSPLPLDQLTGEKKSESLLLSLSGRGRDIIYGNSGEDTVASYVRKFFVINISTDGKTVTFVPVSATISSERTSTALASVNLYIEIGKCAVDENNNDTSSSTGTGFMRVSVANSEVVAVENSPFNSGYPRVPVEGAEDGSMRLRDSAFLEFSGTAGDSLTWDLYNNENTELGLFYDYDMMRGDASNGLETLSFVRSEVTGVTEAIQSSTEILTVTRSDDGKQITIRINRKVFTGQPPVGGKEETYTAVRVNIYCADTLGMRANPRKCAVTTIVVNVENDIPEIKAYEDFAADEAKPSYRIGYSDIEGYVLDYSLERGSELRLNIADIINDADIDMDEYVLVPTGTAESLINSDGTLRGSSAAGGNGDTGLIQKGSDTLFSVRLVSGNNAYNISTLTAIVFKCESTARGEVATVHLQFRDSVQGAVTRVLILNLTVDNVRPTVKPGANLNLTVMGIGMDASDEDKDNAVVKFNVLDYITDVNGDAYDASTADENKTPTYAFIDEIVLYTTEEGDASLRPSIYGPASQGDPERELDPPTTACGVDWFMDEYHQAFIVSPKAGVYGTQKVALKITDSGYVDGSQYGVLDGKTYELVLTITIANPLNEIPDVLDPLNIAYGVTRTVTIESLLNDLDSQGYSIGNIEEIDTNNLVIYAPGDSGATTSAAVAYADNSGAWRIYAANENTSSNLKVTFVAGSVSRERTLPVNVIANTPPVYRGDKQVYEYTTGKLDDSNTRTIKIYPEAWFTDGDLEDMLEFVGPVTSSQSVRVEAVLEYDDVADGGKPYIRLTFNRRGESVITINVKDLSGRVYPMSVTVMCNDAPEMSWFENVVSLIEANWMWFWIIVGGALLFIILLIIIIIVIVKKRKMRREIEALLESETELEEEMMRLNAAATPYQSFGYLPPTQQTVGDPGLMLGGGAAAPMQNSLQLNAGGGPTISQGGKINSVPGSGPINRATSIPGQRPGAQPPTGGSADGFDPDNF